MFNRTKIIIGSIGAGIVSALGGKSAIIPPNYGPRVLTSAYARARYIRNRSKYYPHQGQRERLRRMMGGFAGASTDAWHPLHQLNN